MLGFLLEVSPLLGGFLLFLMIVSVVVFPLGFVFDWYFPSAWTILFGRVSWKRLPILVFVFVFVLVLV